MSADRVVRVDGRRVDPGEPALHPDDPLARAGDGLIETMRARGGVVFRLERHLARLAGSARALGMEGVPGSDAIRDEVGRAVAEAGPGDLRVRVAVSTRPTLWVEAERIDPLPAEPVALAAVTIPGGWDPGSAVAGHKTASRAGWAWAERRARAAGAATALLLDADGHLGEAVTAAVFAVVDRRVLTAPARGLLPGVGREALMELVAGVEERSPARAEWERASEILVVSSLQGVRAVTRLDGRPVGSGVPGPVARGQAAAYRLLVDSETGTAYRRV